MTKRSGALIESIIEKFALIWNAIIRFFDTLPYPKKYVFGSAGVAALFLLLLIVVTGGTSAGDVARMCENDENASIRLVSTFGDRKAAEAHEKARDICCPEMRKAARQLSSYERDVVIAEIARGMNSVYSKNDRDRFIKFYENARYNATPAEWQRMNYPSSVRTQCVIRVFREASRG